MTGAGSGSNTSMALRTESGARTSVAWPPPAAATATRIVAAPASSPDPPAIHTSPPPQS